MTTTLADILGCVTPLNSPPRYAWCGKLVKNNRQRSLGDDSSGQGSKT